MNVLHIINDQKFIVPCQQTFLIKGLNNLYLKSGEITNIYLEKNNINVIFIHFLHHQEISFFSNNNLKIPIIWMFWGGDGFSLPLFYNQFIGNKTLKYIRKWNFKHDFSLFVKDIIKDYGKRIVNYRMNTKNKIGTINRFSYIVPIVPGDYDILTKIYLSINVPSFHFNYISPVFFNKKNKGISICGKNVLVGNSSSPTNNHIEIFSILNQIRLENRTVIIPLNYGDTNYKNAIKNYLAENATFNYKCLDTFLAFDKYQEIISSCEIMIMNHYRQQALGNIVMGLISGVTIYLNKRSSLYHYLINLDFIVYPIDCLLNSSLKVLKEDEKKQNKKLSENYFGVELQQKRIRKLLFEELELE